MGIMQETFVCEHCGKLKPINPKLKGNQRYCGAPECQRARKRQWQRHKMATDPQYRASHRESQKKWRQSYPAHLYQRQYRQQHPEYVERNRQLQRLRNQKRRQNKASDVIVKMDALTHDNSALYLMAPLQMDASPKIVKMDPLIVQLTVLSKDSNEYFSTANDCKDRQY